MRAHCGRGHNQQRSLLLLPLLLLLGLPANYCVATHSLTYARTYVIFMWHPPPPPFLTPLTASHTCHTHLHTHTHVSRGSTLRLNKPAQICIDIESKTKGEGQVGKEERKRARGGIWQGTRAGREVRSRCKMRRSKEKDKGKSGARRGARKGNRGEEGEEQRKGQAVSTKGVKEMDKERDQLKNKKRSKPRSKGKG